MRINSMYELSKEQQLALTIVLMEYLNASDWKELFLQTGCEAFAQEHTHFYEDVGWIDGDLEKDCAEALNYILNKDSANLKVIWRLPGVQTMTKRKDERLALEIQALIDNESNDDVDDINVSDTTDITVTKNINVPNGSDFYCEQILSGKHDVQVVIETELVLSFHHSSPYFEHHVVIIPKKHIDSLTSLDAIDAELAKDFLMAIHHVTSKLEKQVGGCRVSSNVGKYQTSKHLHWYVHAGKRLRNEDGTFI